MGIEPGTPTTISTITAPTTTTPKPSKGFTGHLAFAIAASALGSAFQHGYNTGVVNAPQTVIEQFINDTNIGRTGEPMEEGVITIIWSLAVSIFCVGGMIGGLLTAVVANKFGRKGGLLLNNIFVVLAAVLMTVSKPAKSYEMLIAGRFFIGINSGLAAGLTPMYLSEISPAHLRGATGTTYQLVVTISIVLANILGLPQLLGTEDYWNYLLGFTIVATVFQVCTLPLCPESPKFLLLNRGRDIQAQEALTWLRGVIEVHDEMDEMRAEGESMKSQPQVTLKDMFTNPLLRMPLIISLMVMMSQQLSGINAIMFFSTEIFKSAGLTQQVALYATIGMGVVNVLMTFMSLILVEKSGRRTLHLFGLLGMDVVTVVLTICMVLKDKVSFFSYVSIILVIAFVVFFATGPGSIPWFLVAELFGQGPRPMATSIAVGVNWFANFIVGVTFLPISDALGSYVFLVFTVILTLFALFTYKKVPETKNKTVDEMTAFFRQKIYQ